MAHNKKISMFFHMLKGAFFRRRTRLVIVLLSITIASSMVSGMSTLYADINSKMEKELRTYGANMIITKTGKKQISLGQTEAIKKYFKKDKLVGFSPYLFDNVDLGEDRFIAVGIDLNNFKKVNPYIKLALKGGSYRLNDKELLIGKNVSINTGLAPGDIAKIKENREVLKLKVSGVIESGGVEDDQVFIKTAELQKLSGLNSSADVIYVSYIGKQNTLQSIAKKINASHPSLEAKIITKISKSEGSILQKITSLVWLVVLVIFISTILCVAATLMSMVFERKKEIGLKKSLGASNTDILFEYISEGSALGFIGGILGWLLGNVLAQFMSESIFNSAITIRLFTLPLTMFISLVIAGVSSIFPARLAFNIEPAVVLKDE